MFFVYILQSLKDLKYYVGSTKEVTNRIEEHNTGECKSTWKGIPWRLIRTEEYLTRTEAVRTEKKIKARGIARYLEDIRKSCYRVAPSAPMSGVLPKGFFEEVLRTFGKISPLRQKY